MKVVASSRACSPKTSTPGRFEAPPKVSAASSTARLLIGCSASVRAPAWRQPRPLTRASAPTASALPSSRAKISASTHGQSARAPSRLNSSPVLMNSSTFRTAPADPRCGSTVRPWRMRSRAVTPATSSASSGESFHCAASRLALMTSAICSTGIAGVPRTSGLSRSSRKPPARPSRKEPLTTQAKLAIACSHSPPGASRSDASTTPHSLMPSTAITLLTAAISSTRSVTWPRERDSCTTASTIAGEVESATTPASAAEPAGTPKAISAAATSPPHSAACKMHPSASQGLSNSQRGRMRVPSSNSSAPMARSISGFQPASSRGSSRRSSSGPDSAPISMWPQMRGNRQARCSASASSTAASISSAMPSTGLARNPSSVHSGPVPNAAGQVSRGSGLEVVMRARV